MSTGILTAMKTVMTNLLLFAHGFAIHFGEIEPPAGWIDQGS